MFEQIAQRVGKTLGILANQTTRLREILSDNVRTGYEKSRTKKCIWCKNEFPMTEIRQTTSGYLMCEYCLEGLAAAEATVAVSEKYKQHASQIIDAMLVRVAADKDRYSAAFNSFIMEGNRTIQRLFPEDAGSDHESETIKQ